MVAMLSSALVFQAARSARCQCFPLDNTPIVECHERGRLGRTPMADHPLEDLAAQGGDGCRWPEFTAYQLQRTSLSITCAPTSRAWMEATSNRFAQRCLPLLIANQAGWVVLNPEPVRVVWDGTDVIDGVAIEPLGAGAAAASSHFGHGILTWNLPYLFRTPPGYNLLVRGPANWPKDGVTALEGIVETDWAVATFTMNWKLTRAHLPVTFDAGEPICMIVPQRRGELEEFVPRIREIASAPRTLRSYRTWRQQRKQFLDDLKVVGSEAAQQAWQRHYFQGSHRAESRPHTIRRSSNCSHSSGRVAPCRER